jgi:hypothetical protein
MRARALLISSLLLVTALVAAGCAAIGGGRPDTSGLVASSIRAAAGQKDPKVHYAVRARIAAVPSPQASPEQRKMLASPVRLEANGGVAKDALTIAGELGLAGRRYRAEALVGEHETFVNLLGAWYGDRTKGLADAATEAKDKAPAQADTKQVEKALRWVYDHSDEVLDATVTRGPDIDGPTWQAKGRCDASGLAKLAKANGHALAANERTAVATFCRAAELTYVAGADDRLPREIKVALHLDKATMAALEAAGDGGAKSRDLDRLDVELDLRLTGWGDPVTYDAPADTRPMSDLGMAVLGLLFQAAA